MFQKLCLSLSETEQTALLSEECDHTVAQGTEDADAARLESLNGSPKVPGYLLLEPLGEGCFGQVWSAKQESTQQEVAVKILKSTGVDRLSRGRELERLRAVSAHPHIVTLLDADLEAKPPYLVMSLMQESLDSRSYSPEQIRLWFEQMAQALQFVHQRGLLHCDLKPSNVLLDETGSVRLADFGQAAELGEGEGALGSLGFMAPEQAEHSEMPSVGWDVYGLGATAYRALTGDYPRLRREDLKELSKTSDVRARLKKYAQMLKCAKLVPIRELNPTIAVDFSAVVERCLETDPDRRTSGVGVALEDLQRSRKFQPLEARKPWSYSYLWGRFVRRNAVLVVLLIAVIAGVFASATIRYQGEKKTRAILAVQSRERAASLNQSGRGQEGLLWLVEALNYDSESLSARFAIEHFSPSLELIVEHGSAPDSVAFAKGDSLILSCSDSTFRVWDKDGQALEQQTAPAVQTATVARPYTRRMDRLISLGDAVMVVLSDRLLRWTGDKIEVLETENAPLVATGEDVLVRTTPDGVDTWSEHGRTEIPLPARTGAVTKSGRVVALVSNDTVSLYRIPEGKVYSRIAADSEINQVSFSPDDSRLLVSCFDGSVLVLDAETGEASAKIVPGHWPIYSSVFDPQGEQIYVCDYGGRVTRWDATTFRQDKIAFTHQWLVYGVEFSTDGKLLATHSTDGTARVWDRVTGRPVTPYLEHRAAVRTVAFSSSGDRLATATMDGLVRVYSLGNRVGRFHQDFAVTAAEFTLSGDTLVALGQVKLDGSTLTSEANSRQGNGGLILYGGGAKVALWTLDLESPVTALSHHSQIAFAGLQDGSLLSVNMTNGTKIWERKLGSEPVSSIAINREGTRLAASLFKGSTTLFALSEGEIEELTHWKGEGKLRTSQATHPVHLCFSRDGQWLTSALGDEVVQVRASQDGKISHKLPHDTPSRRAVFSPDSSLLATVSDDGSVFVWNAISGELVRGPMKHDIGVWDANFGPSGRLLATASGDSTCCVWDVQTGALVLAPLRHLAPVVRVSFSPDGRWILTGAKDGRARLWDARTGDLVSTPLLSDSPVFSLDFTPKGEVLSGAGDGSLSWSETNLGAGTSVEKMKRQAEIKTGMKLQFLDNGKAVFRPLTPC